jgi:hypothetical protein
MIPNIFVILQTTTEAIAKLINDRLALQTDKAKLLNEIAIRDETIAQLEAKLAEDDAADTIEDADYQAKIDAAAERETKLTEALAEYQAQSAADLERITTALTDLQALLPSS